MAYKLIIMKNDRVVREHVLHAAQTPIGRRQHNTVILDDATVSGKHAIIRVSDAQIDIEDLGSTNGTYLNGDALTANQRQDLQLGDRLVIGPYRITVQLEMDDAWADAHLTPTVAKHDFEETYRAGLAKQTRAAVLEIISGVNAGRTLPLTKVVTTIGTPGVGILSLTHRLNAFVLNKVEGDHDITINDETISSEGAKLQDGDRIRMASIEMVFRLLQQG